MSDPNQSALLVLAGGAGTRLWPLSTEEHPKPFLSPDGTRSLLQRTLDRHGALVQWQGVVLGQKYAHLAARDLEGREVHTVFEPTARNTAPAVVLGLLAAPSEADVLIYAPADAWVHDEGRYRDGMALAIAQVREQKTFAVLGIQPDRPETGYGYLEADDAGVVSRLTGFCEKPDLETAESFLASGRHLWNAGVFVFDRAFLEAQLKAHCGQIFDDVCAWYESRDADGYGRAEKISIDFALMERIGTLGWVVPVAVGWSDLGTLESWAEVGSGVLCDRDVGDVPEGVIVASGKEGVVVRCRE